MKVCAWDTSGDVVVVALGTVADGLVQPRETQPETGSSAGSPAEFDLQPQPEIFAQVQVPAARKHAEALLPTLVQLLEQVGWGVADLQAVLVGVGPGPFTGLRVGLATARVLGLARQVPVLGVGSMQALAWQAVVEQVAQPGRPLWVITDALRREVHAQRYELRAGGQLPLVPVADTPTPQVLTPDAAMQLLEPEAVVVGSGAWRYQRQFPSVTGPSDPCAAALIGWIGQGLPSVEPRPMYLRRPDVTMPAQNLSASPARNAPEARL